jgi:hypothetical protein
MPSFGSPQPLSEITQATLAQIRKSATEGVTTATGIRGYDLAGLVALIPVNVPARNNTSAFPRTIAPEGSEAAVWRALLNLNSSQKSAAVGRDFAGSLTKFEEQDCFAPYQPLAKAGRVTLDAMSFGRNYADSLAVAELQTLNQLFIEQDLFLINGQAWAVHKPGTPTLTTSNTGGTIAKEKVVKVKATARSGANYFSAEPGAGTHSGSSELGEPGEVETSSNAAATHSVTATLPAAIKGAVAYDWYVAEGSGTFYYYTTTTTTTVTIKAIPTSAEAVPSLPLITAATPRTAASATTNTSYSSKYYNGVLATTLGDYGTTGPVQPGTGTSSGAIWVDNAGAALTASGSSVTLLDKLNAELWDAVQLSPTAYMMNSLQAEELSKLLLEGSIATTFLPPTEADARTNLAGGGFVGRYINKAAGGVPVNIEVHPRMAPGTIMARTDRVPFPGSNIGTVFEQRCQYDTMKFNYAASYTAESEGGGPREDFEIRSMEATVNHAPLAQAIATNVA